MANRRKSAQEYRLEKERIHEAEHKLVVETFTSPLLTHAEEKALGRRIELMTNLEERLGLTRDGEAAECAIMMLREAASYRKDAAIAWKALGTDPRSDAPTLGEICHDPEFRQELDCRYAAPPANAPRRYTDRKKRDAAQTPDGRVVMLSVVTVLIPPCIFQAAAKLATEGNPSAATLDEIHHCMNDPGTGSLLEDQAQALTLEVQTHFDRILREGVDAIEELAERNTRLVMNIAKGYAFQALEITDLFQEGNLGLMKAIMRYDYRMDYKFSTYATWWIRQAVSRKLGSERDIALPDSVGSMLRKMNRAETELTQAKGSEAVTEAELAAALETDVGRIRELRSLRPDTQSLHEKLNNQHGDEYAVRGDLVADRGPGTEDQGIDNIAQIEIRSVIEQALPTRRERDLVLRKFGFIEEPEPYFDDGHSPEMERQALAKLKYAFESVGIRRPEDILA